MGDWYADTQLLAVFPEAAGMTPEQLAQVSADVVTVYDYITQTAATGVSDDALRTWGEGEGIDPDRMSVALTLLRGAGKLVYLPSPGPLAVAPPDGGPSTRVLTEGFTADALRKAAGRLGVEVSKSATKDEIAAALTSAG